MSKAPDKGQKMQALYALHWMPDLSPAARRVGAWFVWHANASSGRCDPGQARLQTETGLSRRTVQNAVNELVDCGVVSKKLRGTESSSYEIHWQALSDLVAQYEERANNGGKVVAPKSARDEGRKKLRNPAQETAPMVAQETTPKLLEDNSGNKHVFRVGVSSEKSEADVISSRLRSEAKRGEDDAVGERILATREDSGFLGFLDRAVNSEGRTFSKTIAEPIRVRLESIFDGSGTGHGQGDPMVGRAYRLIETEFDREDAA